MPSAALVQLTHKLNLVGIEVELRLERETPSFSDRQMAQLAKLAEDLGVKKISVLFRLGAANEQKHKKQQTSCS